MYTSLNSWHFFPPRPAHTQLPQPVSPDWHEGFVAKIDTAAAAGRPLAWKLPGDLSGRRSGRPPIGSARGQRQRPSWCVYSGVETTRRTASTHQKSCILVPGACRTKTPTPPEGKPRSICARTRIPVARSSLPFSGAQSAERSVFSLWVWTG